MKYSFDLNTVDAPAIKKMFSKYSVRGTFEFESLYLPEVTIDDTVTGIFEGAIKKVLKDKSVTCWERLQYVIPVENLTNLQYSGYNHITINCTDMLSLEGIPNDRLIRAAILYLEDKMYNDIRLVTTNLEIYGVRVVLCNAMENCVEKQRVTGTQEIRWNTVLRWALPFMSEADIKILEEAVYEHIGEVFHQDTARVRVSEYVSDTADFESDESWDYHTVDNNLERFKFYTILPDTQVAFITEEAGNKEILVARALLHDARVYDGLDYKVIPLMDRIFAKDYKYQILMQRWAEEHGYYTKERQDTGEHVYVSPKGEKCVFQKMYIRCKPIQYAQFKEVPFMDTFNITAIHDDKIWAREYGDSHKIDTRGVYKKIIHIIPGESGYIPCICR